MWNVVRVFPWLAAAAAATELDATKTLHKGAWRWAPRVCYLYVCAGCKIWVSLGGLLTGYELGRIMRLSPFRLCSILCRFNDQNFLAHTRARSHTRFWGSDKRNCEKKLSLLILLALHGSRLGVIYDQEVGEGPGAVKGTKNMKMKLLKR